MSLAITKLAAAVPAPQVNSGFLYQSDYNLNSSLPAAVAAKFIIKDSKVWAAKVNQDAVLGDIVPQYGAGLMGLVHGLVISVPGSGLSLPITAGGALINGVVQQATATAITVTNGTTNYIWFKQDGTFESRTATSAPSIPGILIGIAVASGGNITSVDGSGVVYIYCGMPIRFVADAEDPKDTPPATWIGFTQTLGGLYFWDTTAYRLVGNQSIVSAKTGNYTVSVLDRGKYFTNSGATGEVDFTLPSATIGAGPFTFIVNAAQTLKIIAGAGDSIRIAGTASANAGNITNATIGGIVKLICMATNKWIAETSTGTWTIT